MIGKKILLAAIVLGLVSIGATLWLNSSDVAKAQNNNNQNMADKLAEKLNLNESQVSEAMEQIHSERQAEMKERISQKLDEAISDGVITAEQKEKILARQTEMEQKRERERQEMQAWEEENGIDMSKLKDYGIGGKGGFGGGFGPGGPRM